MNKIGILYHPVIKAAHTKSRQLQDFLVSRGISVWVCSAWEREQARAQLNNTDLIISVGGDGTILRAAHVVAPEVIPITGVNLGKLGFMTEFSADETIAKLPSLLAGEGWIDERAMLEAELPGKDRESPRLFHALNDIVVARGAISRLVRIEVTINRQFFATYKADGVIAATATGSTGYSLAAGGPILPPQSDDFLLVSIMPHLSPTYPLVLPSASEVQLRVATVHEATISIDGHINIPLPDDSTIKVRHSSHKIHFLRMHPKNSFYSSLEQKLRTEKR